MPTLAQRWMEEGIQRGVLIGRQQALAILVASRFQLLDREKHLILSTRDPSRLYEALKLVISAETKEEILACLKTSPLMIPSHCNSH